MEMNLSQNGRAQAPMGEIVGAVEALELAFALFDRDDKLRFCNAQFRAIHSGILHLLEPGLDWAIFVREAKKTGSGDGLVAVDRHLGTGAEEILKIDAARPGDRWVRMRMQPLADGEFVLTEADITDAYMAAELQSEAENMLRRVLDASGALIMMVNINDGSIVYRTQAHRELVGDLGSVHDLYADLNDRSDMLADILATGQVEGEMRMKKFDGTTFPGRYWARMITYDGEEVVVSSTMDMTQLHAQRDELARQREASFQNEKMTALGELLAGVAHELNNPLSVVVGQSLMMKEEDLDDDLARRVDKISASAERCAKIIKTFLAMARQKPTKLEPVNVAQVIEVAMDVAGYGLRASGARVTVEVPEGLPDILADEDQIAQVFINLIVNAEHAVEGMGTDASVIISARYDAAGGTVLASVADNGPGIPKHLRYRIFEPFFTTKAVGSGTGIGLALCHRIVGTHNGTLEVGESDQGGADFQVVLPAALSEGADAAKASPTFAATGFTALVVDDEIDVAEMICDMLKGVGIQGTHADSGEGAVEILASGKTFDLIFSDLKMPGLGGVGLLEEIHIRWPEMAGRFAFITGDAMSPIVEDVRKNVDVPLLEKPVAPHELRHIVGQLVGNIVK